MQFRSVTVSRSYEQVVQQIQEAIQHGDLAPGERLPAERELSASFSVSRGVVREAIKVLHATGLVEARQGSGTYVRPDPLPSITRSLILSVEPEEKSVARLFEFRRCLETFAAREAASRRSDDAARMLTDEAEATARAAATTDIHAFGTADRRFHHCIYDQADNRYLAVALGAIRELQRDVVRLFAVFPGSMKVAAEHHQRVADAIRAHDPDTAATAMDAHVTYTADVVTHLLQVEADEAGQAPTTAAATR